MVSELQQVNGRVPYVLRSICLHLLINTTAVSLGLREIFTVLKDDQHYVPVRQSGYTR